MLVRRPVARAVEEARRPVAGTAVFGKGSGTTRWQSDSEFFFFFFSFFRLFSWTTKRVVGSGENGRKGKGGWLTGLATWQ